MVNTLNVARNTEYEDISTVVTVREAAKIFNLHPSTIREHINSDYIAARKIGKIWVCSLTSLRRLYPGVTVPNILAMNAYETD